MAVCQSDQAVCGLLLGLLPINATQIEAFVITWDG